MSLTKRTQGPLTGCIPPSRDALRQQLADKLAMMNFARPEKKKAEGTGSN